MLAPTTYKLVISGPVGSGKTTAITTLSDIPVVQTDARPTDAVAQQKQATTVAMDYGLIHLGDAGKIHLYGTPGQDRFNFMWSILLEGAIGLILLINNDHAHPTGELERFLSAFSSALNTIPFCVGITHMDENHDMTLEGYRAVLDSQGHRVPLFSLDARSRQDMNTLLMAMLSMIAPEILIDHYSEAADLALGTHTRYIARID